MASLVSLSQLQQELVPTNEVINSTFEYVLLGILSKCEYHVKNRMKNTTLDFQVFSDNRVKLPDELHHRHEHDFVLTPEHIEELRVRLVNLGYLVSNKIRNAHSDISQLEFVIVLTIGYSTSTNLVSTIEYIGQHPLIKNTSILLGGCVIGGVLMKYFSKS